MASARALDARACHSVHKFIPHKHAFMRAPGNMSCNNPKLFALSTEEMRCGAHARQIASQTLMSLIRWSQQSHMHASLLLVAAWAAHATNEKQLLAQRSLELLAQWQEEWRSTAETEARQAVESGQANSAQEMDAKPKCHAVIFGLGMRGLGFVTASGALRLAQNCLSFETRCLGMFTGNVGPKPLSQ